VRERARVVCFPCEDSVKEQLDALAGPDGLFAQLVWQGTDALIPGSRRSSSEPNVKTSKTEAPSPVNLQAVNLLGVGGVVHTLQRWVGLWYQELGFRQPVWRGQHHFVVYLAPGGVKVNRPGQLDNTVKVLLNNLPWACEHRSDFARFRQDVRRFVEDARLAIDPTTERKMRVPIGKCPAKQGDDLVCGRQLTADPFALAIRCPNCGTSWSRDKWLQLGQEQRTA
jgi:hypothetical protein